jgi:aspartyl-tRNA(Asn)/glutamyl-tRNA(Gln) amidotransferase subunit A
MPTLLPSPEHLKTRPRQIPEAVEESLRAIHAGAALNAFVTVLDDRAKRRAIEVRDQLLRGEQLPLGGWLIAVKDNISIANERLTCGSGMLRDFRALYTATAVERLERAGAIVLGKTNLDEFAMGSSSETGFFGSVHHPEDPGLVAGGSSGGSAVSVAAGWVHAALGSETGGSVRQPAAFCGISGLKPTYGRVSRYGLVAFGSSLDQIAPFSRSCAHIFDILCVMAGEDANDSSSACVPVPERNGGLAPLRRKLRIGLPKEYFVEGVAPDIVTAIERTADELQRAGHELVDVSLPHTHFAIPVYYIVAPAEASSNLARFDGARYGWRHPDAATLGDVYELTRGQGFGAEVRRRIMIGTYVLSAGYYDAYYKQAQKVRRLILEDFLDAFKIVDVILAPTTPTSAFKQGEKVSDPLAMYLSDIFTAPTNLAGIPSVNVPIGRDSEGRHIGVQVEGPLFSEELVLQVGAQIEDRLGGATT